MTAFLLIDKADGEEHDRYDVLADALMDAAVRAYGSPVTPVHHAILDDHVAVVLGMMGRTRVRKHTFVGPYGSWIVKAVAS